MPTRHKLEYGINLMSSDGVCENIVTDDIPITFPLTPEAQSLLNVFSR